jgi:hypothetical protein
VATDVGDDLLPSAYKAIDAEGSVKNAVATTSIKLRFDRFLLPTSTFRQSMCVQSNLKPLKSREDCTQPIALEPSYDPVHREIVYRQSTEADSAHLSLNTTYRVTVFPSEGDAAGGIQAFDGAPLEDVVAFTFSTTDFTKAGARVDELPKDDFFCKSVLTRLQGCAFTNCHYDDNMGKGAAEGLDMSSPARIAATAIGHTAHGSQTGEHATDPDESPLRFGRAMPIIDPKFPGNSYLVYKILASRLTSRGLVDKPSDAEVERLRAAVVVGMQMPPSTAVAPADLDALINWIFQGAPTPATCP